MKTIFSLLLLTCLLPQAQAQIQWQHCYGGTDGEVCNAISPTFEGGYILAGYALSNNYDVSGNHGRGDCWVVKISYSGAIEWQKCYGGSNDEEAYDIQQTTDSGYIVVGITNSNDGDVSGNHGGGDVWVIKLSATGIIQWQKCYGGSGYEDAFSVRQTNEGGYIVAGRTNSYDGDVTGNHGSEDAWIIKLNDTGSIEWAKCYGGSGVEYMGSLQQTYDGGYIFDGNSDSIDGDITGNHGNSDVWVVKLTATGSIEWQKSLGGSDNDGGSAILQTKDSGYIVGGITNSNDGDVTGHLDWGAHNTTDGWIVKLTNSGTIVWNKCIYNCAFEIINTLLLTNDGGCIFAGLTCGSYIGIGTALYGKLSSTGSIDWINSYGGSSTYGPDEFYSLAPVNDGSGIAVGKAISNDGDVSGNHGMTDMWVVKFDWHSKVEDVKNKGILLINPNPANDYLRIISPVIINDIIITNIVGQVIYKGIYNVGEVLINISEMRSGMYYIKINETIIDKFIKE